MYAGTPTVTRARANRTRPFQAGAERLMTPGCEMAKSFTSTSHGEATIQAASANDNRIALEKPASEKLRIAAIRNAPQAIPSVTAAITAIEAGKDVPTSDTHCTAHVARQIATTAKCAQHSAD